MKTIKRIWKQFVDNYKWKKITKSLRAFVASRPLICKLNGVPQKPDTLTLLVAEDGHIIYVKPFGFNCDLPTAKQIEESRARRENFKRPVTKLEQLQKKIAGV